ncbi:MAG: hypothetical protein ACE5I8_04385, partial [Thermodesulfobacteriota bacterium]
SRPTPRLDGVYWLMWGVLDGAVKDCFDFVKDPNKASGLWKGASREDWGDNAWTWICSDDTGIIEYSILGKSREWKQRAFTFRFVCLVLELSPEAVRESLGRRLRKTWKETQTRR